MNTYLQWTRRGLVAGVLALGFVGAPSVQAQSSVASVSLRDDYYHPANLTVPAGTTVRWLNQGTEQHTVTSDAGLWSSGTLMPGQSYSQLFATPGTYDYHCAFHRSQGMVGRVTVSGTVVPPGGGANLALGKAVRASTWLPANPPQLAVDGDPATFWASAGVGAYGAAAPESGSLPDGLAAPVPGDLPPTDSASVIEPGADEAAEARPVPPAEPLGHNNQWILVDLGGTAAVQRLHMVWTANFARSYFVYAYRPSFCGGWCTIGVTNSGDGDDTLALSRAIGVRYLMLYLVYPAVPGGLYELREWEIFGEAASYPTPQPSRDVAAGRPARASSQLVGYEAARATDRQISTEWRPAGPPAWIYVDLGAMYLVDRAVLRWSPSLHATTYGLYAWPGYGWQLVRSVAAGDGGEDTVSFSAARTRYLLLYAQGGPGPTIGLSEIEVWTATGSPYALAGEPALGLTATLPGGGDGPAGAPAPDLPNPRAGDDR